MDDIFWHKRWERGETAFHESKGNQLLKTHFEKINLPENPRIFIPLCSKTKDILWLLSRGIRVVGVELSNSAINDLFIDLDVTPNVLKLEGFILYQAKNIDIFVGDIFQLSSELLGQVDAIYDRAALVALPERMRVNYASHLQLLTKSAPQLLITFEYKQPLMQGPPFSITNHEINQHYQDNYEIQCIETQPLLKKLKGKVMASESIWLLKNHRFLA